MKKRILIGMGVGLLSVLVIVGAVFAGYNFWVGQANVTVVEGVTVTKTADTGGAWDNPTKTWAISALKAGESRSISFDITNTATSGSVKITPVVIPSSWTGFTLAWTGDIDTAGTVVGFGVTQTSTFTISVLGDVMPGSYSFTIMYDRTTP